MEEEDNVEGQEILGDDYDTYQREKEFIEEITGKYHVLIFSKTWCPFCKKLKELFTLNNIIYNALELDNHANGPNIQDALEEMTGAKRPLPAVFICRKFRGGYSEIHSAWANGTLEEWLNCIDTDFPYDLVVLGGGSGGIAAAKEAARLGKKVAICDYVAPSPKGSMWGLGGTCANVGCIPKSLMHRASLIYHDLKDAESFGWDVEPPETHNWESMIEKIQEQIKIISWDFKKQFRELGIAYFVGKGILKDRHTVEVYDKDGKKSSELQGTTILIAVGSRPMYLDAIGAEKYCITSDDIFSMKKNPGRTLVIGGGYVAIELASFLNVFGCEVKVLVPGKLLHGFDQGMVQRLQNHLESRGIEFHVGAKAHAFEVGEDHKILVEGLTQEGEGFVEVFETVVLDFGRCANTYTINLEKIGVKIEKKYGRVVVNEKDQTEISNIFAVGDCSARGIDLCPSASKQGRFLAQRLFNQSEITVDYTLIPFTIFTTLEYAFVGLTEEQAKEIHCDDTFVYHDLFTPYLSRPSHRFDSRSYTKMITLKSENERIVGLHILAPNAGEIILGYAAAMKLGATKKDLDSIAGAFPTNGDFINNLSITVASGIEVGLM